MVGQTVLNYKILEKLGEGGMGVVFKAEDLSLRRTVALKFLSAQALGSPEEKARLLHEAQAAASLDHAGICPVHSIHEHEGAVFLAMAYVDGPSLAEKIKERPLPLDEALDTAIQIAQALQEAHERGIIHRDIKPSNVMLTGKGQVKIMDFGLAQVAGHTRLTKTGTMLGTPAYMSPEQADSRATDRRSDLWSLGVVLYEMLTAKLPFEAEHERAVLYAIISKEPQPVTSLRAGLPLEADRILAKALAKDPQHRYQHADDLLVDLKALRGRSGVTATKAPLDRPKPRKWRREMLTAGVALAVVIAALTLWMFRPEPAPVAQPTYRASLLPPPEMYFAPYGFAVSPDGERLAFVGLTADGSEALWVRSLNARTAQQLNGTQGASYPFWAPDSRRIGFFAEGSLKIVDTSGSAVQILAAAQSARGGAWNEQGTIVFSPSPDGPLFSISDRGGTPSPVTQVVPQSGKAHGWPSFLPDGRHFFYFQEWGLHDPQRPDGIYVASLDGVEAKLVSAELTGSVVFASGHLLYRYERSLLARPFDVGALEFSGPPLLVLDQELDQDRALGRSNFSISSTGVIVFQSVADAASELIWYGPDGVEQSRFPESAARDLRFSPDGRFLAVTFADLSNGKFFIRVHDLARGIATQLTQGGNDAFPTWSPDGRKIAYGAQSPGGVVNEISADGSGEPVLLFEGPHVIPNHYSPDGRSLVYMTFEHGRPQLAVYDRTEGTHVVIGRGAEAQFSPDGKWLASLAYDGRPAIVVQPFPVTGSRIQISERGSQPSWSHDGKKLLFMARDRKLMQASIDVSGGELRPGAPEILFQTHVTAANFTAIPQYAVTRDGRFLVNSLRSEAPLTLVMNWPELLRK
jgi:Tol biopolymer transport system component/predicted Ser/Thr protein kinase